MQQRRTYLTQRRRRGQLTRKHWLLILIALVVLAAGGFLVYRQFFAPVSVEEAADQLQFDSSVTAAEKQRIQDAIREQNKTYRGSVGVRVGTSLTLDAAGRAAVVGAYVPVAHGYAVRQSITTDELSQVAAHVPADTSDTARTAIAEALGIGAENLTTLSAPLAEMPAEAVAFVPVSELSPQVKLLALDGAYYLDNFQKGAVFRRAVFSGSGAGSLHDLALNKHPGKDTTLKVNMTGVTALTRQMMRKLSSVGSATYFSEKIGPFLADADITHISNEVSFKQSCTYSTTLFCSPPEMIEALKASGVDLVELTGNHNNDVGRQYNTNTINQYHELGWGTFGGGLNAAEAAKPFIADQKGTTVAFLGYNAADSPGSGAIATADGAGANSFNSDKAASEIANAKQQADFVIVDVQFWECYAYPNGYVEFPECDRPIGQQTSVFRQIADMGADMVVGSSAHQPQTYEVYNGTPIFYGLGNLYFDQTRWPGTERGIILTHYFADGKLLQTKLSPTVYHQAMQTRLMNADEAAYLLERLKTARETAGL